MISTVSTNDSRSSLQHRCLLSMVLWLLTGPVAAQEVSPALALAQQLNEAFIEVADTVSPAVVVIEVAQSPQAMEFDPNNPLLEMLPPEMRKRLEEQHRRWQEQPSPREPRFGGRGSGVVIREDGYILTNTHVVEQAERIRVRLKNGKDYEAEIRGIDPQSDIAVVKIDAKGLPTAKLGESSKTRVGEFAVAIGAPFELDYSVTFGHISAKGRTDVVQGWGSNSLGATMDQDFIQTDASINPGNSGGPLVNIKGEVIGINTLIRGLNTGIGFAVPIDLAKSVADELIRDGKFSRAWLGIGIERFMESELRGLVAEVEDGLVVRSIQRDGPAIQSDLRAADIIAAVEGQPVITAQQLRNAVRAKKVGSTLQLDVYRPAYSPETQTAKAKKIKVSVQTEPWPEVETAQTAPPVRKERTAVTEPGLTVETLTVSLAEKHGAQETAGVLVTEVKPSGPAAVQRIRPGDIITSVNFQPVADSDGFDKAIRAASLSKGIVFQMLSDGTPNVRILKDSGD